MTHPFTPSCRHMEDTSRKLKLLAMAGGVPMTEMCRQIVDRVFDQVDREKIKEAEEKLGRRK